MTSANNLWSIVCELPASGLVGHQRSHVDGVDAVTASSAIPARNIELQQASANGAVVLRRAGMFAGICAAGRSIGRCRHPWQDNNQQHVDVDDGRCRFASRDS